MKALFAHLDTAPRVAASCAVSGRVGDALMIAVPRKAAIAAGRIPEGRGLGGKAGRGEEKKQYARWKVTLRRPKVGGAADLRDEAPCPIRRGAILPTAPATRRASVPSGAAAPMSHKAFSAVRQAVPGQSGPIRPQAGREHQGPRAGTAPRASDTSGEASAL